MRVVRVFLRIELRPRECTNSNQEGFCPTCGSWVSRDVNFMLPHSPTHNPTAKLCTSISEPFTAIGFRDQRIYVFEKGVRVSLLIHVAFQQHIVVLLGRFSPLQVVNRKKEINLEIGRHISRTWLCQQVIANVRRHHRKRLVIILLFPWLISS